MPHIIRSVQGGRRGGWRAPRGRTVIFGVVLVLALAYGAFALVVRVSHTLLPGNGLHAPRSIASLPGLSAPVASVGRINILVLGIDHRPGKGNEYLPYVPGQPDDPGRSDTMAIFSVDSATKTASILSIPRDLWVEVQDGHGGWTIDRINEAYHTGEVDKLPGGGGQTAAAAVTHNFGIPIDHYVALDFAGFTSLVDALGGIDLDAPNTITATVLPRGDTGGYEYTFFAGRQHLNGELALAYSRFRLDADGDFGRIKRQQAVVLAAEQRALSLGWIDQPLSVWNQYHSAIRTDIPSYQLPGYALLAKQMQGRGVTARSLGEAGATRETVIPGSGADVLLPNPEAIARIVSETLDSPTMGAMTLARLRALYPSAPSDTTGALPPQPLAPAPSVPAGAYGSGSTVAPAPRQQPSASQLNPGPGGLSGAIAPAARLDAPPSAPPPESGNGGGNSFTAPFEPSTGPPLPAPTVRAPLPTPTPRSAAANVPAVVPVSNATPGRTIGAIPTAAAQQPEPIPVNRSTPIPAPAAATSAAQ